MNSRLARWRILLYEFDYEIIYKPGQENGNADALSRIFLIKDRTEEPEIMPFEKFMESSNIYVNKNVNEVNEMYTNIPADYSELITLSSDLTLKLHVLREYIQQLGHIGKQVSRMNEITEVTVVSDNEKKYLYAITNESLNQSPIFKELYNTLINVKNVCIKENIFKLAFTKIMMNLNFDVIRSMIRYIFWHTNIKINIYTNYEIKKEQKQILIEEQYITCIGGHQGISRTVKRLKSWVYWKGIKKRRTEVREQL